MSAATVTPEGPEIQLKAYTQRTAFEQYWKHVVNRTCLAILADSRMALGEPKLTLIRTTRGRDQTSSKTAGSDVFFVKVEPVQFLMGDNSVRQTEPLHLRVLVAPTEQGPIQTLATLRTWPTPKTPEVLFRYRRDTQAFERKAGLSGDLVYLFEQLLKPHKAEMLRAMGFC